MNSRSRANRDRRDAAFHRAVVLSHYIPPFTEVNGPKQKTVCGEWVTSDKHAEEPTCGRCRHWLTAERQTEKQTPDAVFGDAPESYQTNEQPFDCTGGHPRETGR